MIGQMRQMNPNQPYTSMQANQVSVFFFSSAFCVFIFWHTKCLFLNLNIAGSLHTISQGYTTFGTHMGMQQQHPQGSGIVPSSYGNQNFQGSHPGANPAMVDRSSSANAAKAQWLCSPAGAKLYTQHPEHTEVSTYLEKSTSFALFKWWYHIGLFL